VNGADINVIGKINCAVWAVFHSIALLGLGVRAL
jgi:hypothetical protein